ncbi:uncharacterized protein KQ657_003938 [Scheffersomyces spartinae]|uniref:Lipase n=1 Tax=Scheffersomyces spartinae TaxID=45513 RepID=A0A9P8AJJ6_9ASCO|nr:uncharacterized protein KQ657_003938 [Scheffersomyces spartinae]KAG7194836.1 hypothetical protein KQ657_003938 [Scheffersomyces spartinae]
MGTSELASKFGYTVAEHVVTTEDGYLLVLHKLEKKKKVVSVDKRIVYFHHGLMTCSELWLCGSYKNKNLPFLLADLGHEVWLGNNRGNKYSRKHLKLSSSLKEFWDFSLDEFAMYDICDTLKYIYGFYGCTKRITYVGFSQGCSQLFACLSLKPYLNEYLDLFVALSPAIVPRELHHPLFKVMVKLAAQDESFLYTLLGKRALFLSVSFWCHFLGSKWYETIVDICLKYLFGWSGTNISKDQKVLGYPYMFLNSSVKCLVHWFQIIHSKRFQMYNETCSIGRTTLSNYYENRSHSAVPFPISFHLNVPMLVFYGDADLLVDIKSFKSLVLGLNPQMREKLIDIIRCPTYEHMDTIWGDKVYEDVFEKIIQVLET